MFLVIKRIFGWTKVRYRGLAKNTHWLQISCGLANLYTGTYGDSRHSETLYIPLGLKYETSEWTFKATIPYVESSGPADTIGNGYDRINLNNRITSYNVCYTKLLRLACSTKAASRS